MEGMPHEENRSWGQLPEGPVFIEEHGIKYGVDLREGHKTGFYLDQRDNRRAAAEFFRGRRILDMFCYSGGFALNAIKHGHASEVLCVDTSEKAIALAQANVQLNGLSNLHFQAGDGFRVLQDLQAAGQTFRRRHSRPAEICPQPRRRERRPDGLPPHQSTGRRSTRAGRNPRHLQLLRPCASRGLFANARRRRAAHRAAKSKSSTSAAPRPTIPSAPRAWKANISNALFAAWFEHSKCRPSSAAKHLGSTIEPAALPTVYCPPPTLSSCRIPKVAQLKNTAALRSRLAELGIELPIDEKILTAAEGSPLAEPLIDRQLPRRQSLVHSSDGRLGCQSRRLAVRAYLAALEAFRPQRREADLGRRSGRRPARRPRQSASNACHTIKSRRLGRPARYLPPGAPRSLRPRRRSARRPATHAFRPIFPPER